MVKKANGEKELNIVIETKQVEGKSSLRGEEDMKISCAKIFQPADIRWFIKYPLKHNNNNGIKSIIEILKGE